MPLGTEVNLGPFDVVLDGVAAPPKCAQPPVFGSFLLWPNGCMDEDATWYRSRPRPRLHCVRRGPSSPAKRAQQPPFSAHVYCGHGRPSQLLLCSCCVSSIQRTLNGSCDSASPELWMDVISLLKIVVWSPLLDISVYVN